MSRTLLCMLGIVAVLAVTPAWAGGVSVGSSSIIGTLDYSDTFTTAENGGNAARLDNVYPYADPATAVLVENTYGNPQVSWNLIGPGQSGTEGQPGFGGTATDATAAEFGAPWAPYPGPSGAGSDTGIVQNGSGYTCDYGIPYDLRNKFTVQFDAERQSDRVDLTISSVPYSIFENHSLCIIFRDSDNDFPIKIGLYNSTIGEFDTGFVTGISAADTGWHNYGATFDLDAGLIDVYVDEDWKGQIDLNTAAGGEYLSVIDASINDYISIGRSAFPDNDPRIFYADNFQVGTPITGEKIPGDANKDGKVDGSDVTILAGNWQYGVTGGGATWAMGDFNEDGKVDGSDVTILAGNWQYGVTAAASSVPEPSSVMLLLGVFASLMVLRCRNKQ